MRLDGWLRERFGDPVPGMGDWAESERYGMRREAFPLQPRNTNSNLAYALVGIGLWIALQTAASAVFALCMVVLAVGSTLYHGWPTRATQRLDHVGMYLVFTALVASAFGAPWWVMLIASVVVASVAVRWLRHVPLEVGMGASLVATIVVLTVPDGINGWGVLSLLFFIFAYGAWQLDRNRDVTGHWGHWFWHIATSVAIGLMYVGTVA